MKKKILEKKIKNQEQDISIKISSNITGEKHPGTDKDLEKN